MIWLRTSSTVCHHLTSKTTSILLLLLLLVAVALCSGEVKHSEKRCLGDEPAPERKFLTHNSEKEVITLLGSPRIASRLLASIFSIFANEVLGYNVTVAPIRQGFNSLDPQVLPFARCTVGTSFEFYFLFFRHSLQNCPVADSNTAQTWTPGWLRQS